MKRLLIIFTFLLLTFAVSGQAVIRSNPNPRAQVVAAPSYEAEYSAILAAMTVDPEGDTLTWQNAMVKSLVDGGYWARMDLLYIFANRNYQGALLNWINPGTCDATEVANGGALVFTKYQGFDSDGSAYATSNYNPTDDGTNFTQNSGTLSFYNREYIEDPPGNEYFFGIDETYDSYIAGRNSSNSHYSRINANSSNLQTLTNASGLVMATRRAAGEVEDYRNGASIGSDTDASTGLSATDFLIFTRDGAEICASQLAIIFVMNGISDEEATAINTIFETYMDAIGAGVEP